MKYLAAFLFILLLLLQYKLWLGDGGLLQLWHHHQAVEEQQELNDELLERNQSLEAEVVDLKQGEEAIEERARTELGMIKDGETFYQVVDDEEGEAPESSQEEVDSHEE